MALKITRTLRPFVLTSLGLIPGACQSPVARYIPKNTVRELQQNQTHAQPKQEEVAKEIEAKSKKSIAWVVLKSWTEGLGLSACSTILSPSMSSTDFSLLGMYSSHGGRFRSSLSQGASRIYEKKIPSYTSGLVENNEVQWARQENQEIDEAQKKKAEK